MRKLATIRKITKIEPILGKDRVEMAYIDGWTAMVSKADNFKPGDMVVFCEEDSVFPHDEQWEFLKKYNYRIKIQRFKSENGYIYSQGLVLPTYVLPKSSRSLDIKLGLDVTELLHITQYEPEMDIERNVQKGNKFLMRFKLYRKWMKKRKKGSRGFPKEVSKTDEERIQNYMSYGFDCYTDENGELRIRDNDEYIATEKVDGQSGTFMLRLKKFLLFFHRYEYIVCSRNLVNKDPNSSYNVVSKKYGIEKVLKAILKRKNLDWVCIQGECIGPNIQQNKYRANDYELKIFNLIDNKHGRFDTFTMKSIMDEYGLKTVPIIDVMSLKDKSVDDILKMSNGKSQLYDTLREGIVFRSIDGKKSFKAVSPEFLFKYSK